MVLTTPANGYLALAANIGGQSNSAIGYNTLPVNTSGVDNTAVGAYALQGNTTGGSNTAVGFNALGSNNTGGSNTAIGYQAGSFAAGTLTNYTAIGFNSGNIGTPASNSIDFGNSSVTLVRCGVTSLTSYSDARVKDNVKENVPGLDFIGRLRPVTYNLNLHREMEIIASEKPDNTTWEGKYDIEKITQSGFIAQEVEKAANEVGYDFNGLHKPSGPHDLYGLGYTDFVVPLVKSVQELKKITEDQQKTIDRLLKEIEEMKSK